jgi:F-type H+-transporting ATPase subunit delta
VSVVAHTYAQALFEAAKEQGRLDEVRAELREFVTALHDVPELHALLRNPQLDPSAKAEALSEVMEGADELVRNFLRVVAEKGRAPLIEEIAGEFEELIAAEEQILKVELTTAVDLSDQEATSIVEQIEQASGRRVEAMRSVDPSLVGGLVLKAGSLEVDSSVRGRLERLRQELTQGARL